MLMKGDGARVHFHTCTDCMHNTCLHPLSLPVCTAVCVCGCVCMWVCPTPAHLPLQGHMVVGLDWDWRLVATAISQPVISLSTARINLPTDGWLLSIASWKNTYVWTYIVFIQILIIIINVFPFFTVTSIFTHTLNISSSRQRHPLWLHHLNLSH